MGWILDFEPSARFPVYTRGNVSEVFPDPITPLNATTGFLQNFEDGYRDAFVDAGVWDRSIYEGEVRFALLGCLGGFVYINMSYLRVFAVRVPGYTPELLDLSYGVDSEAAPYANERQDWHEDLARSASVQQWIDAEVFGVDDLPVFDAERHEVLALRASRPDLNRLGDADLVVRIRELNPVLRRLFRHHAEASLKAGFALGSVVGSATEAGMADLALDLVSGVGDVDSVGATVVLNELAERVRRSAALTAAFDAGLAGLHDRLVTVDPRFAADFARTVVGDWGFRGPGEWELRRDTWQTDPTLALALLDRMRHGAVDPQERMAATRARQDQVYRKLSESLPPAAREALEKGTRAAALWVRARERSRTSSAMLLHEQRLASRELGRRAAEVGALRDPLQIYMLLESELDAWLPDRESWTALLAEREQTYLGLFELVPPFMITGLVPDRSTWQRVADHAEAGEPGELDPVIVGAPGSPGTATGSARVVHSPADVDDLEPGTVLIADITDPSWTPLFLSAAAVVTEVGGTFSHGPIVCRELGTPCVVAAEGARRRLKDGQVVRVDGTAGTVTVLGS